MTLNQTRLMIAGFFVMLLGAMAIWLLILGIAIVFSSLIPYWLFYRCPHCRRLLSLHVNADYCPFCGKKLTD